MEKLKPNKLLKSNLEKEAVSRDEYYGEHIANELLVELEGMLKQGKLDIDIRPAKDSKSRTLVITNKETGEKLLDTVDGSMISFILSRLGLR